MLPILMQVGIEADSAYACLATGLCGLIQPERPVAPGVMFLAVGLVAFGAWGIRQTRKGRLANDYRSRPPLD